MYCRDCTHWFQDDKQLRLKGDGRGICLKTTMVIGGDGSSTIRDEGGLAIATALMMASFAPKMTVAQLETRPEFGCVQFESK